ncbi:glycoside hydrolase [Thozetella sp. PMI_491]|nr:glycoside hydrolase [Thozetella sp. PMI_491]
MLDAGRHYYPPEFLIEMCAYLSYFKQNEFHVHLSDNMFNYDPNLSRDKILDVYSSLRLLSDDPALAGLVRLANESYTKEQFEDVQQKCASRGVTVIPEIEAPAHALAIVRWKPELALDGDFSMLNLSHPDTIPTLKSIWKTFLPWFHSKTVSIGADEYSSSHVQDYTRYVDELSEFIRDTASKDIRIWGTFPPSEGGTVAKNVAIQHWASFEDNAYFDFIKNGYQVLNSDLSAYIVLKFSPWFMQGLNKTWIFHGNPDGSAFAPNIFDPRNATNNPPRNHSLLLGHVAALWNDWGRTASTALEAYWAWRDSLPALADKQWGGKILEEEYDAVFPKLHAAVPGQNLDRTISTKSDLILEYGFGESSSSTHVIDTSGNGYHGTLHGDCVVKDSTLHLAASCYLQTPLLSKGRNYTLSFAVKPTSSAPGTLFAGPDSVLMSGYSSYSNITMVSGGHPYALNYTLPTDTWTRVQLSGRGSTTLLTVSGVEGGGDTTHAFNSRVAIGSSNNGVESTWLSMAFEAPLARIGGDFTGLIKDISLKGTA